MLLDVVERNARAALRPPARLDLSTWIERSVVLPQGVSAQPGRVRLWSYQRGIADAISDPSVERVTLVKSARLGFTFLLGAAIAHFAANDPSPILVLQPTESDARDFVVSDLEPLFEASPALRNLLTADASEAGRNTLLHRRFAGGSLKVIAAKAPRNLRRHTARVVLIDEADAMEPSPTEGSAILLAEKRTLSFPDRKIVLGSTPLQAETSNIMRAWEQSDQRAFEVPCPDCGEFTEIVWEHIQWEKDKPETARFACPHCGSLVDERHKMQMLDSGRWRALRPSVQGHAGFRCNALISPLANASWAKLAAEFLAAKNDPETLRPFLNTILAQPWRDLADEVDEIQLAQRVEPFGLERIPQEVLAITVGADVQRDRIEAVICGWTRDNTMLILGHVVIWGAPSDDTTWREVDELLRSQWKHPFGGSLKVDAAAVDAGDGVTMDAVLGFCQPRLSRRVMAIKGAAGNRPALVATKTKRNLRLFIVGVDSLKGQLFDRIARGRSVRFSDALEPVFFEQLGSERRLVRYQKGQPVRQWVRKSGMDAEALDATVYAMAARAGLLISWESRELDLKQKSAPATPNVYRSRWMSDE